ncbi:MAG TPA: carboxypeptidase-like regulatory domain-containing protein [Thermoanaerobaculia bacterium]|nr:carboxypeptidase-like regulatory domain-containing protein [Thermoanaerobaculia bacterium]
MVRPSRSRYVLSFFALSILILMWACVQPRLNRQDAGREGQAPLVPRQAQRVTPRQQTPATPPVLRPGIHPVIRTARVSNLSVRGYITAVGGLNRPPGTTAPDNVKPKEIYLPGVTVHLEDAVTGAKSNTAVTDLSGRFTVFAPAAARYRLCWASPVYGSGCDSRFISVTGEPQFISAVRIPLPPRDGFVAVTGHVTTAEGSVARTFDPMLNINSFATVSLDTGAGRPVQVYVNNYGDYLLPYVPVKQRVNLIAAIENAKFAQEIRPEAKLETFPLNVVNLRFENHRPTLDPLIVFDSANRRVQNATPGSTVFLEANGRDADGDSLDYAWFVGEGQGKVVTSSGRRLEWELPAPPGRYTAEVVAYDNKGGYSRAVSTVLSGAAGIPFTGIVVNPFGGPVPGASIEIVGNPVVLTDGTGRFQTNVKEADRYVLNIRKQGFALNSRVYDRAVTGGRWILRPAQVVTVTPTIDTPITHQRGERDCPGPDATRGGLGPAGNSLTVPQWQDEKGTAIDPPSWWSGPRPVPIRLARQRLSAAQVPVERGEPVILPRDLKLPGCGPGISVVLKANTILDSNGNPAVAPFQATISTIDVLSPQQMPGDDTVVPSGGGGAFLQSFGAGSLDLPPGFKLRPGATATITIPIDRARRVGAGSPLAPTMPLLAYDEQRGLWVEEGVLTLTGPPGAQAYTGSVKHFTTYNADTFFGAGAACVRVFSPTLPGQYDLEVIAPYPDGTPHYKKYQIDNVTSTEHVIYNLTPNMNLTVTPMTTGPNPNVLGFYVVNSGLPENPVSSPNPPPLTPQGYTSCNNFVVLKVGNAPDSPVGGEFLHGLGYIDGANLGFDDLTAAGPTGNALRDAVITASRNYNDRVDPNKDREDFGEWKLKNGFDPDPNVKVTIAAPGAGEFTAQYANSGDLGFGRDMHCLKQINGDVACYVTNYGSGYVNTPPGGGTPDQDDANAAGQRATVGGSAEVATVAMEYSPIEGAGVDKVVKFYVYKKGLPNYGRSISANLDGRGERPVPQLCMICHGGAIPTGGSAFGTAADAKLGARFVPFDHRFFTFPTVAGLDKASQETPFKDLSEKIAAFAPPGPATDPIVELVSGLYNGGLSGTQILNFNVPGWVNGASAAAPNQSAFYQGVLANACRTCHTSQPYPQLQFNTSEKFVNLDGLGVNNRLMLGTTQLRACGDYVMPHALRTHDIFWDNYWDVASWGAPPTPYSTQFQNFGNGVGGPTWSNNLCTSFLSPLASTPSKFYSNSIQPIWNGKCVACHIAGGAAFFFSLVDGLSYAELVPLRVTPFDDNPATSGALLQRLAFTDPREPTFNPLHPSRMPQNCIVPPAVPGPGQLPCLEQFDIDKIKAWIRNGAN